MSTTTTTLLNEYISLISNVDPNTAKIHQVSPDTITKNDTLIVVDMQHDFLPGGSFGVAEGDSALDPIASLIHLFANKGATVIATRDYHPIDHCSFNSHGGPFPPHCVQGSRGSFLHEKIGDALQKYISAEENNNVKIVFKAFSSGVDSFGAFEYDEESAKNRISTSTSSHCSLDWTGGYYLFSSNQKNDINAPPDVMSVLNKKPLKDLLPVSPQQEGEGRMFVCGLAMDFCVIDTAVNYVSFLNKNKNKNSNNSNSHNSSSSPVYLLAKESRAAHIPGFGKFGTGFLTNPEEMVQKMTKNGIVFGNVAA